jgi:hypothetical protein
MKHIVSLGVDCSLASYFKDKNIRQEAYPFDWVVSYYGIDILLQNKFDNFFPNDGESSTDYIRFMHDSFPKDITKYERRIERLFQLIDSVNDELLFIRLGHSSNHHFDCSSLKTKPTPEQLDEIKLSKNIYQFLTRKNPKLKFEMHLILNCNLCKSTIEEEKNLDIQTYDLSQSMPEFSLEESQKNNKYWGIYLHNRTSVINQFLNNWIGKL